MFKILSTYFNSLTLLSPKLSAKHAFNLFAYPFKSKLKPTQLEFLNTAEKFKVDVNNKKVQCYKWGSGKEKILFVHGWQSNSYRWKPFIENFDKDKYTMYAFDAPGHGNSEGKICTVPHYESCISSIISKVGDIDAFVGHSIGSFSCASFMHHKKYKVKNYISLASPYDAFEFFDFFKNLIALSDQSQKNLADEFENFTSYPLGHYSLENFAPDVNAQNILIVHDKQDNTTPYTNAKSYYNQLLELNKNAKLILTEGLKHKLRSAQVVAAVSNCLEQRQFPMSH